MVELVIVLAVVWLLAGHIIPSFLKARHRAAATQCLENCLKPGEAFIQYSQDNDGRLVPSSQPRSGEADKKNSTDLLWTEWMGNYSAEHHPWHFPE